MALINYNFYKNEYGGSAVTENSFEAFRAKGEIALNRHTFNHIVYDGASEAFGQIVCKKFEPFTESELKAVQYGMCALMDALVNLQKAESQALAGNSEMANVKSRSSGGESITYESRKTVYDEALTDPRKKTALLRTALMEYMQPDAFRWNPFYAGSW